MKGQGTRVDEFVFVLIAGVLLIVVLLLAWGETPEVEDNTTNITFIREPFVIGTIPQDVARSIRIGDFSVSFSVGSEVIAETKNIEVKKGYFGEKNFKMSGQIGRDMDMITDGFLVVYVLDTNSLGNLIVKVNNETVFNQKVNPGQIDIPVERDALQNYNVITVSTSNPGWRFWANSVYRIEKVEFGINFYGKSEKRYNFQVFTDEWSNFVSGEVVFNVEDREGDGDLIIDINGNTIFKGYPDRKFKGSFERADVGLKITANTITFSTERGTSYEIDDSEIIIIHSEKGQKIRSFDFRVGESSYNKLKEGGEGKIKFYILDSNFQGALLVTLTDAEGNRHPTQTIQAYSQGEQKIIEFGSSDVSVGTNIVTFEASPDGSFTLSNLEIEV